MGLRVRPVVDRWSTNVPAGSTVSVFFHDRLHFAIRYQTVLEFGDILSTYPMTTLDLGGLDVVAADYVDILAAINDVQVPFAHKLHHSEWHNDCRLNIHRTRSGAVGSKPARTYVGALLDRSLWML